MVNTKKESVSSKKHSPVFKMSLLVVVLSVIAYFGTGVSEWFSMDIFKAATYGRTWRVNYLIENGADVNAKTETGWTPLMAASSGRQIEIVKVLIENGADVNAKNEFGEVALMETTASRRIEIEIAMLLIKNGADVNAVTFVGKTAWSYAFLGNHGEIEKIFEKMLTEEAILASNNARE